MKTSILLSSLLLIAAAVAPTQAETSPLTHGAAISRKAGYSGYTHCATLPSRCVRITPIERALEAADHLVSFDLQTRLFHKVHPVSTGPE